jgi:antitoxin component YwqK of YwqJK toxin-antitoxin module
MKNIIFTLAILLSWTTFGQFKPDTSVFENETSIKQQLDDSTLFIKRFYKTKDETTYTKHQINDSTFYKQNFIEGKQYVKLIHFELIDSLWIETSAVTTINGSLISIREIDKWGKGYVRQFSENGNVLSISEVEGFKNNGRYFGFYPSGLLKEKGEFKDHLKTGEWIYFLENGDTLAVENYVVKKTTHLKLEKYTTDELNSFQWGGTSENELVSLQHGVFKTFLNGKLEKVVVFEEGKVKE